MPGGGRLLIEVGNHSRPLEGSASGAEEFVRLAIIDTGKGMAPETKAHLFEPFFTTKPVGRGTGLGLAMVYGIVTQSGGRISVQSEPGCGTTFEILFPRTHDVPRAEVPKTGAAVARGNERVLVVEDEPLVREIAVRSLKRAGYHVLDAANGREALDLAAKDGGPIDLLLTDLVLPGQNGRELANEFRRGHPGARVLFASGYTPDAIVQRGSSSPTSSSSRSHSPLLRFSNEFARCSTPMTAVARCAPRRRPLSRLLRLEPQPNESRAVEGPARRAPERLARGLSADAALRRAVIRLGRVAPAAKTQAYSSCVKTWSSQGASATGTRHPQARPVNAPSL